MTNSTNSWIASCPPLSLAANLLCHRQARIARTDPNTFLAFCFTLADGSGLVQADIHRELQAFLTAHRKALIELPRDHGKSVQVCGRIVWELGRNPTLRVKLVCATDALAADRTRFLRDAIAGNPFVRLTFPMLVPATPWSAAAFTVRRPAEVIGPSVAAFGVGTGSTGARADLLVCDDVVDVRALHSQAERDRVTDYFGNNLMNLLEPDGRFWGLCTPWHPDDLNARLKANPAYATFRRAVGPNLEPVWPAKWPREKLLARLAEIGPASFARGYRLLPIDNAEVAIRPEWVTRWRNDLPREAFERVIVSVDPAVSAKSSADASAVVVLGKRFDVNEVRCLEAVPYRLTTPDLVDRIAEADSRWQADAVLFESNAAFEGIKDLLVRHASFGPRVIGIKQSRSKAARVAGFSVAVRNGVFRMSESGQQELFDELTTFPFGAHDDLLDATATGCEFLLGRREPRAWV